MIKLGTKSISPGGIAKVIKGADVVWEKEVIKTLSWNLNGDVSPYAVSLYIPDELRNGLSISEVIEVKIGEFKPISLEYIESFSIAGIRFVNDFESLLGTTKWIYIGTKITVTYKQGG